MLSHRSLPVAGGILTGLMALYLAPGSPGSPQDSQRGRPSPTRPTPAQRAVLQHLELVQVADGQGGSIPTLRVHGANLQVTNGLGATNGLPADPTNTSTWQANGLGYALPRESLEFIQGGGIAIANGSRQALAETQQVFGNVTVFEITVEEDVLRQRLKARARENETQIEARLARNRAFATTIPNAIKVDNSGLPEVAIRQLAAVIESLLDARSPA